MTASAAIASSTDAAYLDFRVVAAVGASLFWLKEYLRAS